MYRKLLKRYDKIFLRSKRKSEKKSGTSRIKPTIFLTHNVPYNTKLDIIVNEDSPVNGKHYGSNLARAMIEKHQPLLAIGGHMHEHFGKDRIRKTTILNSGFGPHVNTLIEIKNGKIKNIKFFGARRR